MTDLKQLLDDAAGPEPAVTDTDIASDLTRGHRALRRRRAAGVAAGAVATAAVISVGWSLMPTAAPDGVPAPAGRSSAQSSPKPTAHVSYKAVVPPSAKDDPRPVPPTYASEVPLVASNGPFRGPITCDLIPKGWAVRDENGQQVLYDPKLKNLDRYRDLTYTLVLRRSVLTPTSKGLMTDRSDVPWGDPQDMPLTRAGKNEAAVFGIPDSDGQMHPFQLEVYVRQAKIRQEKSTDVVVVSNYAWPLAWSPKTLLKFAGSCHAK